MGKSEQEVAKAKLGAIMMTPELAILEQNKASVQRFCEELVVKGNLAVAGDLLAPDFVLYHTASPQPIKGIEGYKSFLTAYRNAFPDLTANIDDILAEENKVALRATLQGTQKGSWMNNPPTNKQAKWTVLSFFHLVNGKIAVNYANEDTPGLFRQLGITSL